MKCVRCGAWSWEALPGVSREWHITERLMQYASRRLFGMNLIEVAREVGVPTHVLRAACKSTWLQMHPPAEVLTLPTVCGVDLVTTGSMRRIALVDVTTARLMEIFRQRIDYERSMQSADSARCRTVVVPLVDWLANGLRSALPNANFVAAWPELQPAVDAALDAVRLCVSTNDDGVKRRYLLRGAKPLLLRPIDALTTGECSELYRWFDRYPALKEAWQARTDFLAVGSAPDSRVASERYAQWLRGLGETTPAFHTVIELVNRWNRELFAGFDVAGLQEHYTWMKALRNAAVKCASGSGYFAQRSCLIEAFGGVRTDDADTTSELQPRCFENVVAGR
jgi:hypothetical protein